MEEFYMIRKHYLIFSEAGKPIYSRFGAEMSLAPFYATMSAVIPKIQSFFWNPEIHAKKNTNQLHTMIANGFHAYVMKKGSLLYMCLINLQMECPGAKDNPDDEMARYFLDERPMAMQAKITGELRPQPIREVSSYIRK